VGDGTSRTVTQVKITWHLFVKKGLFLHKNSDSRYIFEEK
jgi:hypothetical protein